MRFLKELAWKVPLFLLWSQCTWFAKYDKPFWVGCVIAFVFFIMLDLIRWGLKKKRPTAMTRLSKRLIKCTTKIVKLVKCV